jgi:uncharacterized protein
MNRTSGPSPYLSAMIQMGRTQELRILRRTREGLVLGDDDPVEVILPLSEAPRDGSDDGVLRVFVYPGADGRPLATTRTPRLEVGTFARLRVMAIRGAGAQVDWGFEPPLLVPHEEQHKDMEEGRWYVLGAFWDAQARRVFGSTRIERLLITDPMTVAPRDAVDLLVTDAATSDFL